MRMAHLTNLIRDLMTSWLEDCNIAKTAKTTKTAKTAKISKIPSKHVAVAPNESPSIPLSLFLGVMSQRCTGTVGTYDLLLK